MKYASKAPLPFQGQKRNFAKQFHQVLLDKFPNGAADKVFVDVFGGSGLLARIVKDTFPDAMVVYNDFDNYGQRLANIEETARLLEDLRPTLSMFGEKKRIPDEYREVIMSIIDTHEYVDWVTLSTWILFSGKYARSREEMLKEQFYNRPPKKLDIEAAATFHDGLYITYKDYRDTFNDFTLFGDNVVYICDPPYPVTDVSSYNNSKFWSIVDQFDIWDVIANKNSIYFTSSKGGFYELLLWVKRRTAGGAQFFEYLEPHTKQNKVNHTGGYLDYMIVNIKNK